MALQQFLLRFRDAIGNPQDLQITDGSDGGYRLSTREKGELITHYGDSLALPTGNTSNLIQLTTTNETFVAGFYVYGETEATFVFTIDGSNPMKKRINYFQREYYVWFPKPIYVAAGKELLLTVTNNNSDLKDFEGSIFEAI